MQHCTSIVTWKALLLQMGEKSYTYWWLIRSDWSHQWGVRCQMMVLWITYASVRWHIRNWKCAAHLNRQWYTKEVVKLFRKGRGEVVQFQSAWQHLLCRTKHNWYTLSGEWSRSSVHAHMNLLRRWCSQLVTVCLQGTSKQVLTPAYDWVSISCQKTSHPLLHPPWTWDGVHHHNVSDMRQNHKLVNIMLCSLVYYSE